MDKTTHPLKAAPGMWLGGTWSAQTPGFTFRSKHQTSLNRTHAPGLRTRLPPWATQKPAAAAELLAKKVTSHLHNLGNEVRLSFWVSHWPKVSSS